MNSPIPHEIPEEIQQLLGQLDDFIESEVRPLEESNDNIRFFDHRREDARTDWERGGLPNDEWEDLLHQTKRMHLKTIREFGRYEKGLCGQIR